MSRLAVQLLVKVIFLSSPTLAMGQATCESLFATAQSYSANQDKVRGLIIGDGAKYARADRHREKQLADFDIPVGSFQHRVILASTSGRIHSQGDLELRRRQLLLEEGGLCGPTCLGIVLSGLSHAVAGPKAGSLMRSDQLIADLVASISQRTGEDARRGTSRRGLLEELQGLTELERLPDIFRVSERAFNARDYRGDSNTVALISAYNVVGTGGHWLVLLKMDFAKNRALIIDPNFASSPREFDVHLIGGAYRVDWQNMHGYNYANQPRIDRGYIEIEYTGTRELTPEMHELYRR